ncbi:type II toxin-antitoxin system MqsA family antitoxin [Pseudomonas viridiflava]|uniref:type II toxin-antitoxin system MqsA family antitoxin n=1 Tax=Pseudomonas viridiflava TaxID=33069 RepID=UPI000F02554F|nr:type II toxin-antitoxin system MqsA family antitoxin [Pseudomonas viridiflava]
MSIQNETCPICDAGSLHDASYDRSVEQNGVCGIVRTKASECDVCGCIQASPSQVKDNQRAMAAFQKRAEGRLTGQEMKQARIAMKLTQSEAASVFGGGPNSFTKYESDDVTQSEAMDKLFRLAMEVPEAQNWLYLKAGISKHADHFLPFLHVGSFESTAAYSPTALHSLVQLRQAVDARKLSKIISGGNLQTSWHEHVAATRFEVFNIGVHVSGDEVNNNIKRYREEDNYQYSLSPQYSEDDYDRHSQN